MGKRAKLMALIDTESPVSFVKFSVFSKYIKSACVCVRLNISNKTLRNLNNQVLEICGTVTINLSLQKTPGNIFTLTLFVLKNDSQTDIILGRDFLTKEKLTLVYGPSA